MTTVTVLSDTHGNRPAIDGIRQILQESDIVIHLGDFSQDGKYAKQYNKNTYVINGNCDLAAYGENEIIIPVEGIKIFACHGNRYSAKKSPALVADRAKELGCRIALYGHTHLPSEQEIDGVLTLNPGTMSRYSRNSYLYLIINGDKAVEKIVYTN